MAEGNPVAPTAPMSSGRGYRPPLMSDISERYERVTGQFTERVRAVPADAWDNPSPCEGWSARDVVAPRTEWIPGFFGQYGVTFPAVPSADEDPVGAWETVQQTIGEALHDPA